MKRSLIATALLLLCLSGPTLAQSGSTGSIAGTITDPTNAVVPGATITVKSNATSQEFNATSADNGTFNVPALISGLYTVTIAAPGFKTAVLSNVKVDVDHLDRFCWCTDFKRDVHTRRCTDVNLHV